MLKLILIMLIIIQTSCLTVSKNEIITLDKPSPPILYDIDFKPVEGGYFLSYEETNKLEINVVRLHTHINVLERMLDE